MSSMVPVDPEWERRSSYGFACHGPSGRATSPGTIYWALAADTGGQQHLHGGLVGVSSLSEATTTVEPLPCTLELPEAPEGTSLNPDEVNVF